MSTPALARSYHEARSRFIGAATARGATVTSHRHPQAGPDGGDLFVDVARIGPADARSVAFVVSGTHGVEGYAGSVCQSTWLESGPELAPAQAVVLVHAHNPYGFAWVRRVNEDNVDLNRNYGIDHDDPPANDGYDQIADHLAPTSLSPDVLQNHDGALLAYGVEHGFEALQAAVSGGQYRHPDGVFYGGSEPAWSQATMRGIISDELAEAERVAILDLHTGLGDEGALEIITSEPPDSPVFVRTVSWYGERVGSTTGGESVSARLDGEWMVAAKGWLGPKELTAVALEWGTVDTVQVLQALRADAWLHNHGDPTGPDGPAIKEQLRAAFAPDDPRWITGVVADFEVVLGQALTNLS